VVASKDGGNRIAYEKVPPEARGKLADYIKNLSMLAPRTFNRNEQRAYWINLYNALTVNIILEHYPIESILDIKISPGFFASGPWGKKLVTIEGQEVSLDDIEHRILRPIWQDNRVHYGVNCAAVGCPNLNKSAYTAANTDQLLSAAARTYINHPRGVRVEDGALHVSSIFDWYKVDFGGNDEGVIAHLKKYANPALLKMLIGMTKIEDHAYDWALNRIP
jgi:hypothetical protein